MTPRRPSTLLWSLLGALIFAGAGCQPFPRDPERSLERARERGSLRVGVCEAPPWVIREGEEARGIEAGLVRSFARSLGVAVEWDWGSVEEHVAALEAHRLDVVAAGMTEANPSAKKIGATRPYFGRRVLAVPPGENALLVELERHLEGRRSELEAYLRPGEDPR